MLRLLNLEEIEGALLQVPSLVHGQKQRSPDFASSVIKWLEQVEQVLSANRIAKAGAIAALRSELLSVERNQAPAVQFRGKPTKAQMLAAAASQSLQKAADVVSNLIDHHRPRFVEAERIAHQVVAAARARRLLANASADEGDRTGSLRALHQRLRQDGDLAAATVHLEGLVGAHDLLILLDRADNPTDSASAPSKES